MNPYIRCLFLLLLLHELPAQSTYYVRQNASGANTGLSWSDAFTDMQSALAAAQKGDAIWVAGGVYAPTAGADRNISFEPRSGVKLYGGFAGTETALSQRDPGAHVTTLSGDIGDPADTTDNSYTILYLAYPDSSTLIDGFTFRHGYASSDTSFDYTSRVLCGAAVYVEARGGTGLPVFSGCRFLDNFAQGSGGAYFVSAANTKGSTPVFRHCEFRNNWAWQKGGAVYLAGGNSFDRGIEFDHCVFLQNRAWSPQGQGGALYFQQNFGNEEIRFQNCKMNENFSAHSGGAISIWYSDMERFSCLFDSCEIIANHSNTGAGILYITPTILANVHSVNFTFRNSSVEYNRPTTSSVIDVASSSLSDIDSIVFSGNYFNKNGNLTLLKIEEGLSRSLKVNDNVFIENEGPIVAPAYASNNFFYKNKSYCILLVPGSEDTCNVVNNVFAQSGDDNYQKYIFPVYSTRYLPPGAPIRKNCLVNNIFYGNRYWIDGNPNNDPPVASFNLQNNIFINNFNLANGQIGLPFSVSYDSVYLSYNLMDTDCADLPGLAVCGPGNIVASDPMFMDTAALDFRLQPCSPAVNAGSNAAVLLAGLPEDFDGNPRILDGIVDMGAIESLMLALAAPPQTTPACNGLADGAVQFDLQNGCPPYSLQWTNGAQSGTEPEQLLPGAYQFTVTDQKGKVFETAVDIPGSAAFMAGASVQNAGGPATADGSISVYVQSGTGPFTFFWSTSDSTAGISGLLPGIYTVTITDGAGCIYTREYEVKFTIGTGEPGEPAGWVYPNPAVSVVRLGFGPCDEWRLITPEGRVCRQAHRRASGEIVEIALQGLPPGIYAYRFQKSGQPAGQGKLAILPH